MTPATKLLAARLKVPIEDTQGISLSAVNPKNKGNRKRGPERDTAKAQIIAQMWQEGKTAREIAKETGKSQSCVYMQIQRLRRRGEEIKNRRPNYSAWLKQRSEGKHNAKRV